MRPGKHLTRMIVVGLAALAAAVPAAQAAGISPDDRAIYRGTSEPVVVVSNSPDDRPFARVTREATTSVQARSGSFDWGDAMVGGAFVVALLVLVGVPFAVRRDSLKTT